MANIINSSINSIKSNNWETKLRKINPKNPKTLYKIAKALKNKNQLSQIPALQSPTGLVFTNKDKADTIANTLNKTSITTPLTELTSPKEIITLIRKLSANKAPGDDKISNKIIKNCPRKVIVQLYYIFNSCLKFQHFPNCWKNAIVIPIKKPNKNHTIPTNYRPISLLPQLGKLLEKIILTRIKKFETDNEILINEQFGF